MVGFALRETAYRGSLRASGGALQCVRHHCRELTYCYRRVTLYCQGITLLRDFQLTGKVYNLASPSLVFNLAREFVFSRVELLVFPINYLGILDASVPPWSRGTLAKQQAKKWKSKWQNKAGRLKKQRGDYIIETQTIQQICQRSSTSSTMIHAANDGVVSTLQLLQFIVKLITLGQLVLIWPLNCSLNCIFNLLISAESRFPGIFILDGILHVVCIIFQSILKLNLFPVLLILALVLLCFLNHMWANSLVYL